MIDVRLDDGEEIGLVDFEDAVHALEREHDAAAARHGAAGIARARAARHDRHAVLDAEPDHRGDFGVEPGSTTTIGGTAALQRVGAVC